MATKAELERIAQDILDRQAAQEARARAEARENERLAAEKRAADAAREQRTRAALARIAEMPDAEAFGWSAEREEAFMARFNDRRDAENRAWAELVAKDPERAERKRRAAGMACGIIKCW